MMRLFLQFIVCFLLFSINGKGQPFPFTVKTSHPRVLLDTDIINLLESRATANTIAWQELQNRLNAVDGYSAVEIMDQIYEGQQYAFMYTLSYYATGNLADLDSAIQIFEVYFHDYTTDDQMDYDSGYESRSTMVEVSLLYDWLYNFLDEPFRTEVRTRLIYWGDFILTDPGIYGMWGTPYFDRGNNYSLGHFTGLTHLGFAIHSEDNLNGNKFIHQVDSMRPVFIDFSNTRLSGGDANEGWGYGAGYANNFFKALAVFKTATLESVDYFAATAYDEDVMKFLPMATLPDMEHMLPEGDWARESTGLLWDYNRITADLISTYSNDPQTREVAAYWGEQAVPINTFEVSAYRWFPFLFSNQEITGIDYTDLPFYQGNYIYTDTSGTDQFIRRTGWESDDLWVSYRGGGRYGDHAHNGSGHFSIFKEGWLMIDNNILTNSGIEGYDSMHNCIHLEGMNNYEMYPVNGYEDAERTHCIRREFSSAYSYFWTNSAPIYLEREPWYNTVVVNQRQFFFLPEIGKIAIYDWVITENATDEKWFGMNFNDIPTLSSDQTYVSYSNGTNKVTVYPTYPLNIELSVYGNSARTSNPILQDEDYFVHLVSVSPQSSSNLAVVQMNPENGRVVESCFFGNYHKDQNKDYVILFASQDGSCNYDSLVYDVPFTNEILHNYLLGLEPAINYYVSSAIVGTNIRLYVSKNYFSGAFTYTATDAGILSFELDDYAGISNFSDSDNPLNVYYSQSSQKIIVESYGVEITDGVATVFNISGEIVHSDALNFETEKNEINTGYLTPGVYMVTINSTLKSLGTYKLVIN